MKARFVMAATLVAAVSVARPAAAQHLNPLVDLLAAKRPVFGLYAPANPRAGRGGRGGPPGGAPAAQPVTPPPQKTPAELAKDAIMRSPNDYLFDGTMEGAETFDRSLETFSAFMAGYAAAGSPAERWKHPLVVKMHDIAPDVEKAKVSIGRQLNTGVSSIAFVTVESADEVKAGIAAMRFKSKGGTRSDDVGGAPAFWGLTEAQYKEKADVWPLNPRGELLNWTIVESKAGLEKIREIAAVPGIGVLIPGAGTLGGVFSRIDSTVTPPRRIRDDAAWEASLQKVLDACNEFKIPCGFPANDPATMEMRYKQGFRVFIVGWGDSGFRTVEAGVALREAEREIRARRESSNRAIAKHEIAGVAAILAPDVVSTTSASAKNIGRASVVASMDGRFKERPDVVFVRSPDDVSVFVPWGMASEVGHWRGTWTDPDGKVEISGTYFAKWRRINGAWFVESETYVPEKCRGGTFCSTIP